MRKPDFCICENKDADQLRGNRKADQRLCFRYTGSTIALLPKSDISSLKPSFMAVCVGLLVGNTEERLSLIFSDIEMSRVATRPHTKIRGLLSKFVDFL